MSSQQRQNIQKPNRKCSFQRILETLQLLSWSWAGFFEYAREACYKSQAPFKLNRSVGVDWHNGVLQTGMSSLPSHWDMLLLTHWSSVCHPLSSPELNREWLTDRLWVRYIHTFYTCRSFFSMEVWMSHRNPKVFVPGGTFYGGPNTMWQAYCLMLTGHYSVPCPI
jgi:hypothetical protein